MSRTMERTKKEIGKKRFLVDTKVLKRMRNKRSRASKELEKMTSLCPEN